METPVPIFVPILLLIGAVALVYSFVTFDRLVRAQYERHREAWIEDGRPRGFFWRAPECTSFASSVALHRLTLTLLFSTPAWVADSTAYRTLLKRLRVSVLLWNAFIAGALVAFLTRLT